MLILTRKVGERIMIDDDIVLSIERIGHGKVRIGFLAGRDHVILREEVYLEQKGDPDAHSYPEDYAE